MLIEKGIFAGKVSSFLMIFLWLCLLPILEMRAETGGEAKYTVQVCASNVAIDAKKWLVRLDDLGYSGTLRAPSTTDPYYRVWVGAFETEEEASAPTPLTGPPK